MAKYLSLMIFALYLTGCKCDDCGVQLNPGTLQGYIVLNDTNGYRYSDRSGVQVSIDSTSYSTITDSLGWWQIANVQPGTYDISVTKSGFGYSKVKEFQFVGDGEVTLPYIHLANPPTFPLQIYSVEITTSKINVDVKALSIDYSAKGALLVVSTDSITSPTNNSNMIVSHYRLISFDPVNQTKLPIRVDHLNERGFRSGEKVFVRAYGLGDFDLMYPNQYPDIQFPSRYFDPRSQQYICTAVGPESNIVSFIVP